MSDPVVIGPQVLILRMTPKPKERPRFTRTGAPYKSPQYRQWLKDARDSLRSQWHHGLVRNVFLAVMVKGPQRGDLDNLAGSVMDAGTGVIWPDDSVTYIRDLHVTWQRAAKPDHQVVVSVYAEMS